MTPRPLDITGLPMSGAHLIEASAGTGKTYTITSLFLRLLTETSLGIENILAVTFTNAATAELAARVAARVASAAEALRGGGALEGDAMVQRLLVRRDRAEVLARLERALLDIDRAAVFTIHGFAARVLALHAFDTGLLEPRELSGDDRARSFDVVIDFWSRHVATLPVQAFAEVTKGRTLFEQLTQVVKLAGGTEGQLSPVRVESVQAETLRLSADVARVREELRSAVQGHEEEILQAVLAIPHLKQGSYSPEQITRKVPPILRALALAVPLPDADYISKTALSARLTKAAGGVLSGVERPVFELLERYLALRVDFLEICERLRLELLHRFATEVGSLLAREHTLLRTRSFDSLLAELLELLRRPGLGERIAASIRGTFGVVLIDEFQDTDGAQFEIFRRLFGKEGPTDQDERLFLIGDPKQSIYAFRGADISAYLRVAGGPGVTTHTLSTSYRSSPRVVRAQNLLFGGPPAPFSVEGIRYEPVLVAPGRTDELVDSAGAPLPGLSLLGFPEDLSVTEAAARTVAQLLGSGARIGERALSPGDVAVLTRKNSEAEEIQARLGRMGIPAVMHGDRSVFESEDATELRRVLQGLLEPGSRSKLRAALSTRLVGVTAAELCAFPDQPELLERWTERFLNVGVLWRARGITVGLEELRGATNFYARTLEEADGQRRVTNYRHLLELLHEAETREHLGRIGLLRWLESAMSSPTGHAMAAEARQVRLESDARAVVLTTMHKSKGLEYGVVVLPQVGTVRLGRKAKFPFRFHDEGGAERIALGADPDAPGAERTAMLEEAEEALRLAYVGLTRARHQVVALVEPGAGSALEYFACERRPAELARAGLVGGKPERSAEEVQATLVALAGASEGAIEVTQLASLRAPLGEFGPVGAEELVEPAAPVVPLGFVRTSSFSAMTRRAEGTRGEALSRHDREGRDVDSVDAPAGDAVAQSPLPPVPAPPSAALAGQQRSALADFPRGAQAGDVLHAIFEHSPFEAERSEERRAVALFELTRARIDATHLDAVALGVERTLRVPLPSRDGGRFALMEVDLVDRKCELEFSMPVAPQGMLLSPGRVADVLSGYASPEGPITPDYVSQVRALEFAAFSGFLRGFIDLVLFARGGLHVLDYKSNYLGERVSDYGPAEMQQAMEHHHYLLQALLYAVAVHRHGRRVIPRYRYEQHFGGIHYLFLRGVRDLSSPAGERRETGVYSFVPDVGLIEALSALLEGSAPSEARGGAA